MFLNDDEKKAIGQKMDHPEQTVRCPRCGDILVYEERGDSIAIYCKTKRCINGGLRGI